MALCVRGCACVCVVVVVASGRAREGVEPRRRRLHANLALGFAQRETRWGDAAGGHPIQAGNSSGGEVAVDLAVELSQQEAQPLLLHHVPRSVGGLRDEVEIPATKSCAVGSIYD